MNPVPHSVLESLAQCFGTGVAELSQFGGGREESDGVVYAYPHEDRRRWLKILTIPADTQRRGLLCLEERLRFGHSGHRRACLYHRRHIPPLNRCNAPQSIHDRG